MKQRTELGLWILGAALLLGVLGDALLRATPWGLNVVVWTAALVDGAAAVLLWRRVTARGEGRWMLFPLLFFAAAFAWRDSATLQWLNGLAWLVALGLGAVHTQTGQVRCAGLAGYARAVLRTAGNALGGTFVLATHDIEWKEIPRGQGYGRAVAAARGLLIALPLLLLFGGLFVAADAAFEGIVSRLFNWRLDELVSHFVQFSLWAWAVAGVLRVALLPREGAVPAAERPPVLSLGIIELGIVLGMLDALFLSFVVVQIPYLFGGAARVAEQTGLTYAQYARRGFFELVTVSALVLPMLLGMHALLRKERAAHERLFRLLAGVLVALLAVVMTSALQRMWLYQSMFGLTELRLYTTAFMGWLAVVFVWFLATVLRGRRERFAFGALVAGFAAIALLDALNPDALIVRTNAGRQHAEQPLDVAYAMSLSADAVPALVAALPVLRQGDRPGVAAEIATRWSPPSRRDWRTWNWGRARAWSAALALRHQQSDAAWLPAHVLAEHDDAIQSLAFSADSRLLATGSHDGTARLWDIAAEREVRTLSFPATVCAARFSDDGTLLGLASEDGTVRLYRSSPWKELKIAQTGHTVRGLRFSPDGKILVIQEDTTGPRADPDGTIRIITESTEDGATFELWDTATGRRQHVPGDAPIPERSPYTLPYTLASFSFERFSPDGHLMMTLDSSGRQLWETATAKRRVDLEAVYHLGDADAAVFSPDGKLLALRNKARAYLVIVRSSATGQVLQTLRLRSAAGKMVFSPDSRVLAIRGDQRWGPNNFVQFWDPATGRLLRTFIDKTDVMTSTAFSPDGRLLALWDVYSDHGLRLQSAATGEPLRVIPAALRDTEPDSAVLFSPDGNALATVHKGGRRIAVWDVSGRLDIPPGKP